MSELEAMTIDDLLKRLDVDLLEERCSYCWTQHPRYLVQFAQTEQEKEQPFIESVAFMRYALEATEKGRQELAYLVDFDGERLFDPDDHQPYAQVIDRTKECLYTCQQQMEQARAAYEEAMSRIDHDLCERMKRVLAMLSPEYDWQAHWEQENAPDLEKELRACCCLEWMSGQTQEEQEQIKAKRIQQWECGSAEVEDTSKALYRLLYLFRPEKLSFQDMYKRCLLILTTPDRRFSVAVHFFKYELALYFWAEAALVIDEQAGQWMAVRAGAPGSDNGLSIQHEEGLLFFQMIRVALNYTWPVYMGNDFEV